MSNLVKNLKRKAETTFRRLKVMTIKLKVKSLLLIFKKVEKRKDVMNNDVYQEILDWAEEENIKVQLEKREEPIKISGQHYVYELDASRHYEVLVFSKQ